MIELLVVIGTIALLLGILFPALRGAVASSKKTTELNYLKELNKAWTMYSSSANGYLLPGYVDEDSQEYWDLEYHYPNDELIDPFNAITYPWRIASYLDATAYDVFLGYRNDDLKDMVADAAAVAYEPQFGYNMFYVGGHWTTDDPQQRPQATYDFAAIPNGPPGVVSKTTSQIRDSSGLITFAGSVALRPGQYKDLDDRTPGSYFVVPSRGPSPTFNGVQQWWPFAGDDRTIDVGVATSVPMPRYNGMVSVAFADGHVSPQRLSALIDQQLFIDKADNENFVHAP
jgi:prepilin-type processing-associated H-X9-DG protein